MKKSISGKMFLAILLIILLTYSIGYFVMQNFIDEYYIAKNKTRIRKIAEEFKEEYQDKEIDEYTLYKFRVDNNIEVSIFNKNDRGRSESFFERRMGGPRRNIFENIFDIKLQERAEIINLNRLDERGGFIITSADIGRGRVAVFFIHLAPIYDGIRISSEFTMYLGFLSLIIGGIIIYPFSKHVTKPIKELNIIAKNMSNFDFSKDAKIYSNDEVGELSQSINHMSAELKKKINELNVANEQLKKDIEKEREIEKMRKQFISDISHELKTPIAIIGGYAEGLKDSVNSDDEGREFYSEVIIDETHKMSELVMELLELSKLESDIYEPSTDIVNLNEIISRNIRKNYHFVKEKNGEIIFESNMNTIDVVGNEKNLDKVINNFMSNAVKYMSYEGQIRVETERKGDSIKVTIFNTGEQISAKNIENIWNPFYKEDVSRNREKGGTGLGLTIVKTILEKNGNGYGVTNKENGVEFWFEVKKD